MFRIEQLGQIVLNNDQKILAVIRCSLKIVCYK